MDNIDRVYSLHRALQTRRGPISAGDLQDRLDCSRPTMFRALAHLRDELGAPILNAPGRGYFYDRVAEPFELPGLWFSADELQALLAMQNIIQQLQPGLLDEFVKPLGTRINELLNKAALSTRPFPAHRFRLLSAHARRAAATTFTAVASALVERRKLIVEYRGRTRDAISHRELSPQRLVNYRSNWYLDAFCHSANALRTFALDRIASAAVQSAPAVDLPEPELEGELAASYGIYAGAARNVARIVFTPARARWVADERWHPQQQGQFLTDGSYELRVPYGNPNELVGEILRHGAQARVVGPKRLRDAVINELRRAADGYMR